MSAPIDWLNDERAVTVAMQRQPDSNTMAIVDNIKKVLPRFAAQLPAGIKMKVFYDRSQTIRAAVNDVQFTLLIAGGAGGGGDLPVPAQGQRHHHSLAGAAHHDPGHLRRHGAAGIQSRQSVADGADPVGRLCGG